MATTPGKPPRRRAKAEGRRPPRREQTERSDPVGDTAVSDPLGDTAVRSLSPEDLAKLAIDSWEPSLLRHMLRAEERLRRSPKTGRDEG